MRVHIGHIGAPGNENVAYTVSQRVQTLGLLASLAPTAPEREWLAGETFGRAFPDGSFNCWGVPDGGEKWFNSLEVGDATLIMPTGGKYGEIEYLGIVKAICPMRAWDASRILWPKTPGAKLFPRIFFFHTEAGSLPYSEFLGHVGWKPNVDLHGLFRAVASDRLIGLGGPRGYVSLIRARYGFRSLT